MRTLSVLLNQNIKKSVVISFNLKCFSTQLVEIGHFEKPKTSYVSGQLFFHKSFGYRGLILFPWLAQVFDRDCDELTDIFYDLALIKDKSLLSTKESYYQALVDLRDRPFIRAHTEAVTFRGNSNKYCKLIHSVPGLDYVAPEDILPYTPTEKEPIVHEMVERFFVRRPKQNPCFEAKEILNVWQANNFSHLKIDVHKETTEELKVTVIPFYMGCRRTDTNTVFSWRFCVRIESQGELAVLLKSHNWRIYSACGLMESISGSGVMGQEIILSKSFPAFQYSSHVNLLSPCGHMNGTFKVEREDGSVFSCRIPLFLLDSKMYDDEP